MRTKAMWLPAIVLPAATILGITAAQPGAAAARGVITTAAQAGYAAVTKSGGAVTSFKYAQATLTVPVLNCTSTATGSAAQLVFLGDTLGTTGNFSGDNRVMVDESCQNGSPSYTAILDSPCNGHNALLTVSPGDTVKLVVTSGGGEFAYDLTTNASVSNPLGTPCGDDSSAGVLTAAFQPGIANFTQAGFRQVQVQGNNQSTPQPLASSAWTVAHYILKGPSGRVDVQPEALLSGSFTSAFANDWFFPN